MKLYTSWRQDHRPANPDVRLLERWVNRFTAK